jgi:ferric-dicitrate binding protein FerR (iron transport regulator)
VRREADPHFTELLVRYWEDTLSAVERNELAARLSADPGAREEFRQFSLQVVAAAEYGRVHPPTPQRSWSRRQMLRLIGGGVAAGVAAAIAGRALWPTDPTDSVELASATGGVTIRTANGEQLAAEGPIPADAIVSTVGPNSSAVLRFADGTHVTLAGESAATVDDRGRQLRLLRGAASANVAAPTEGSESITLTTTEATCSRLGGAVLSLTRSVRKTEIVVKSGLAAVANPAGDPLEVVQPGEYLIVGADGKHTKELIEPVPEGCRWDLTRPLPDGWAVGKLDRLKLGPPALVPVLWFDPYHHANMYQIRSDHRWQKGFARLHPESRFVVKYRVDRPGPGQLVAVVRRDDVAASDTGVIEYNGQFRECQPGQWNVLDIRAREMLDNQHAPFFGPPWVAFLIIFNTYKEDLGLRIAEFQVIPPGPVA